MVSERVSYSANAPTMLVGKRRNNRGSRGDGLFEDGIRIRNRHHHAHRATPKGFGTEVEVLGRFIGHPEFRWSHGQPGDDRSSLVVYAEQLFGSERGLVELDRSPPISNGEHWRDRHGNLGLRLRLLDERRSVLRALTVGFVLRSAAAVDVHQHIGLSESHGFRWAGLLLIFEQRAA